MITHLPVTRRWAATLTACAVAALIGAAGLGGTATAAVAPTVPLATSANYSVLAGSTVTNTGASILHESLGLWPGPAISGFPPGIVVPPGTTDTTNAAAQQAQSDLTAAYVNAAGRPLDATTTADLANLHLQAGVYAGPSKGALALNGPLVLDGAGDASSVFIFQTDSALITGSASTVTLVNGAQACNVFWQVGSSATLGTGSVFVGNIMALTSITVTTGVSVEGRALARNGAVTLDTDTFTTPSCATSLPTTTTTTTPGSTPDTPRVGGPARTPTAGTPTGGTPTAGNGRPGSPSGSGTSGTGDVPPVSGPPRTGGGALPGPRTVWLGLLFGGVLAVATTEAWWRNRSRPAVASTTSR